jgi:hypothetical protein
LLTLPIKGSDTIGWVGLHHAPEIIPVGDIGERRAADRAVPGGTR